MDRRGKVVPLSSLFPPEETLKASKRVQEAMDERKRQLDQLTGFIEDNISLSNLVSRLPDETHHHVMVPFGKAAFFPGRLVHTNELMVLLGEGYYAERSGKQTIEILKRRGNVLETQVQSVQAILRDLKAEASFFDATAIESSEGLVEIQEEYVKEESSGASISASEVTERNAAAEDEEYQRIFSRMAELEKEEEEAAEELESNEMVNGDLESSISKLSINQGFATSSVETPTANFKDIQQPAIIDGATNKSLQRLELQDLVPARNAAFTGSIVEHGGTLGSILSQPETAARSTKPVSRFRMQRR